MQKFWKMTTEGDRAWVGLLAYVVAYDLWAGLTGRETLSMSFDRALKDPLRGAATLALWAGVTIHLFERALRRAIERTYG